MPLVEAASCGVPVCAVDYSAMTDIVKKLEGYPIKVQRYTYEVETNRKFALPDNSSFTDICIDFFKKPYPIRKAISKKTRDLVVKNYTYEKTFDKIKSIFYSIEQENKWDWPSNFAEMPKDFKDCNSNSDIIEKIFKKIPIDLGHIKQKCLFKLNNRMHDKQKVLKELASIFDSYNYYESLRVKK
jgi:hypothetical protein